MTNKQAGVLVPKKWSEEEGRVKTVLISAPVGFDTRPIRWARRLGISVYIKTTSQADVCGVNG